MPDKSNWIFRGSMRRTLTVLLVIIFVPLLLVQVGIYYAWFYTQQNHVITSNLVTARAIAQTLDSVVRDVTSHELTLGTVIMLSEPNLHQMGRLLKITADEDKAVHSYSWILPDGHIAVSSESDTSGITMMDRNYFLQILNGQDSVVSDFLPSDKLTGLPAITISRGIRNESGQLEGVMVGVVSPAEFNDIIPIMRPSTISPILIFDKNGVLIYRWPIIELSLQKRSDWIDKDKSLMIALAGMESTGSFKSLLHPEDEYTARVPVGNTGLVVGVDQYKNIVLKPILLGLLFNMTIVLIVMAASLVLAGIISSKILTSVLRLRRHVRAIGDGYLEHRCEVVDIQELKELGDEFNDMALQLKDRNVRIEQTLNELERSNKDLEQFAYVASHDLQEPLRAVSGFVEVLQLRFKNTLDGKTSEYMGFVVEGVKRMRTLISGLLEYSLIGTQGKKPFNIDSRSALNEAAARLQKRIEDTGAKITADDLPVVYFDDTQLTQLFQNLISNALKFRSDKPPEVHIGAARIKDNWQFCVSDNGIGIDPQYAGHIFQIFHRLHTEAEYPGTGIGLAICKKIVERHGGKIWFEPGTAGGSTFYFTIPDIVKS